MSQNLTFPSWPDDMNAPVSTGYHCTLETAKVWPPVSCMSLPPAADEEAGPFFFRAPRVTWWSGATHRRDEEDKDDDEDDEEECTASGSSSPPPFSAPPFSAPRPSRSKREMEQSRLPVSRYRSSARSRSRQVTGPRWWRLPCSSSERDGPRCRMRFSRMSAATRRDATGPPRSARSCHMARIQDKLQGTY